MNATEPKPVDPHDYAALLEACKATIHAVELAGEWSSGTLADCLWDAHEKCLAAVAECDPGAIERVSRTVSGNERRLV